MGKLDSAAMLANLMAAGIIDPAVTVVEADGADNAVTVALQARTGSHHASVRELEAASRRGSG